MGKMQQDVFEEIKYRLVKPPVLHMPNNIGQFPLYSDTSKFVHGKCTVANTEWKTKINCIHK